ncbi:hypothetical protein CR513_35745, partial [Mucuna pruriens]
MEDETSRKGSTLILGQPFLMTARTKIDVHGGTLSMEFGDTLHPTEDHSLFGIDLIDELVEEFYQLDRSSEEISYLAEDTDLIGCLGFSATQGAEFTTKPTRTNSTRAKRSRPQQPKAKIMSEHLVPNPIQTGQLDSKVSIDNSSSLPPPMELKPLPGHLKYAYLDTEQQLPVIIASNLP